MKIVNVIGGLGNQMFCYAFAKALQCKSDEKIFVDLSHFNHYELHEGFLIDKIFNVSDILIADKSHIKALSYYCPHYKLSRLLRKILPPKRTEYIEKQNYIYDSDALNTKENCYYEGYWQSPLYFFDLEGEIKKMFTFSIPQNENKQIALKMQQVNSVCIHVRRGDYVNAKSFMGICDITYYEQAISFIKKKNDQPTFFIFSNDMNWCEENIRPLLGAFEFEFVSHNSKSDSYWDMYLMTCCKNMIIANSSFSWWAAYLNITDNPLVIAPDKWVNRNYKIDIHLENWVKM